MQGRQFGIGEHELGLFAAIQVDDPLGIVYHIAGTLQFRYHISTHRELGEVDGPVLRGGVLLRSPGAVHRLDSEAGVGDGLGEVGAVHLDEVDAGQAVIEEHQILDAVPGLQFHLLGGGIQHMAVSARIPFLHPVGTGLTVGEEDLSKLVRLEDAQALGVPEYLKGHIGHEFHAAPLILGDPQAGQLLVDDGGGGFVPGHDRYGLHCVCLRDPSLNTCQFPDLPAAGGQLVKDDDAIPGLARPGFSGLNVFDLDGNTGEGVAGVAPLLHPQGAIGSISEGQGGGFVIFHIRVLGALLREQVIPGRNLLGHSVVALKGQRDYHGPVWAGRERANLASLWIVHREHRALQWDFCALLQLYDFQRGLIRVGVLTVIIVADSSHIQPYIVIQVADIILQVAVLILLLADGIHSGILCHGGRQCKLDAAALVLDGFCGVQHLKLSRIAVPSSFRGNSGHILVVHVDDPGAIGNGGGVLKGNRNVVIVDPCLTPNCKYLLIVVLTINSDRIGHGMVRGSRHFGCEHIVVGGAALVDVLGSSQDAVANVQFRTGKARGHL